MLNNSGSKPQAPLAPSNLATIYEKQAKVIMSEGAKDNYQSTKSILMDAIKQKTNGLAKALIEAWPKEARGYLDSIIVDIYRSNNMELYEFLRSKAINGPINEMMKLAVEKNELDTISVLIQEGANVNGTIISEYEIAVQTHSDGITANRRKIKSVTNHMSENSFLLTALINKQPTLAALLLEHGANVNWTNNNGISPLLMATLDQDLDSMKLLLQNGANPNQITEKKFTSYYEQLTPLEVSLLLTNRIPQTTQLLIAHGAQLGPTLHSIHRINRYFKVAIAQNDLDTVSFLLKQGADAKGMSDNAEERSFLAEAIEGQQHALATLLIQHGADVNSTNIYGTTPLLWAIVKEDLDSIRLLLENKADPNQAKKPPKYGVEELNSRFALIPTGIPPLRIALSLKNQKNEVTKLLLTHGANPNIIYPGEGNKFFLNNEANNTLLIQAVANKETDLVKLLLSKQANVNAQNLNGVTALMKAVKNGDAQTVELLVAHKPDLDIRAKETAYKIGIKRIDVPVITQKLIQKETLFKPAIYQNYQSSESKVVDNLLEEDQDILGDSALEIAQKLNLHEIANFLKSKGATPSVKHTQVLFLPSHIIPSAPPVSRQNSVSSSTGSVREGKMKGIFGSFNI